jgi:hypothetical protein
MPVDDFAPKAFMKALQGINLTILLCHASLEKSDSRCAIANRNCHRMEIRHGNSECCNRDCRTRRRECYKERIRSDRDEKDIGVTYELVQGQVP